MSQLEEVNALKTLAAYIHKGVAELIRRASFDRTVRGNVTASLGNYMYTVAYLGKEADIPCATDQTLLPGDTVYVKIPGNQTTDIHICGKCRR